MRWRWLQIEYVLKGIYLGLLLFVALQEPDGAKTALVMLFTLGGLVICLGIAAVRKLREGFQVKGRVPAFILFLLLESHGLVYIGILSGMAIGALAIRNLESERASLFAPAVLGGGVLGFVFWLLRHVVDQRIRLGLSAALAAALIAAVLFWFGQFDQLTDWKPALALAEPTKVGVQLLLGIPIFYLLTFAGEAEESEVEIGAICAAMGVGVWLLKLTPNMQPLALLLPAAVYYVYTWRVLPGLRVFKYVVRGISYAHVGRFRPALLAFRRALQLDPNNVMAREALWSVHRAMDFEQVAGDSETLQLIDLDMCLERAGALLMTPPSPARLQEAQRLLSLVLNQRPATQPAVQYWRAIAATHTRDYDRAVAEFEVLLDPTRYSPDDPQRLAVLLLAWQLVLMLHPELNRRVGTPQLALPGRRMEAIAAVERHLATNPSDAAIWDMKRLLYANLTVAEYDGASGGKAAEHFDHDYTQQLGLALINDPARWQRGVEY